MNVQYIGAGRRKYVLTLTILPRSKTPFLSRPFVIHRTLSAHQKLTRTSRRTYRCRIRVLAIGTGYDWKADSKCCSFAWYVCNSRLASSNSHKRFKFGKPMPSRNGGRLVKCVERQVSVGAGSILSSIRVVVSLSSTYCASAVAYCSSRAMGLTIRLATTKSGIAP